MKYRLLSVVLFTMVAVQSWGEDVVHGVVAVGDVIRATDHEGHYLDDGFKYKVLTVSTTGEGTVEVCSCSVTGEVSVPGEVYCSKDPVCTNFKVTYMGRGYNNNITKLTLPEGMISTAYTGSGYGSWVYGALAGMTNLKELILPKSMSSFRFSEDNGFAYNLRKITIHPDNPTYEVVVSEQNSMIVLEKKTKRLKGITTKDQEGNYITTLTIPEGVTGITTDYVNRVLCGGGNGAHTGCNKIQKLILPASFTTTAVGATTFVQAITSMRELKTIEVAEGNPTYCAYNGVLYTTKITGKQWGSTLYAIPSKWNPDNSSDLTYTTPEGVNTIMPGVICYNALIKHVVIKDTPTGGVTLNGSIATSSSGLKDITLPPCAKFTTLVYNCVNLENIIIPDEEYTGHTATCAAVDGILYSADMATAILCPAKHTFTDGLYKAPDLTKTIGSNCFQACTSLTSLDLNNVTKINSNAFQNTRLTAVDLKNVTTVGSSAFQAGNTIASLNLSKVVTLESNAFAAQNKIKELTIPLTCTSIKTYCFINCPLTKLEFEGCIPGSLEELKAQKNLEIQNGVFVALQQQTLTLPSRVYTVWGGADKYSYATLGHCKKLIIGPSSRIASFGFYTGLYATSITEVEFMDNFPGTTGTHTIAGKAFAGFPNLEKVTNIPINTTTLGSMSFADTPKLTSVTFAQGESQLTTLSSNAFLRSGIKTFAIPNGVKTLGQRIFSESTLEEVNLPNTMTSIDPLTFDGCASLKAINVAEDNANYSSLGGMVMTKDKTKIIAFPQGKSQDGFTFLPPVVETIGQYAFFNSQNLKSVVLPRSIKKIENKAFECCYNLTDIYLMGGASTADDTFATDAAADDAKSTDTEKDHRFGDPDVSSRDFLKNNVTVHYLSTTSASTTGYFTGQETKAKETAHAVSLGEGRAVGQYYITNEEGKGNTVMFVGARNETGDATDASYSYVVPATVKIGDVTYNVNRIADYAFEGLTEIPSQYKEVILRGNYDYIGAKLFSSTSSVQSLFYAPESKNISTPLCEKTSRYEYGLSADYNSVPSGINCYVPKTEYEAWQTFTGGTATNNTLSSNLAYQIPLPAISTRLGTFSREFDMDLQDEVEGTKKNWNTTLNKPSVIAFTGKVSDMQYTDEEGNVFTGIVMSSINCGGTGDGTYIPANTGVLLRAYTDNEQSPAGIYYRIGEENITPSGSNIMQCVTETSRSVSPTETVSGTTYTNYVISGGKYHTLTSAITIPAHKSYMHIPTSSGAKGIKLMFEDDNNPTDIITIRTTPSTKQDAIYDLQGRRITSPSKGLYILNGKKVRY